MGLFHNTVPCVSRRPASVRRCGAAILGKVSQLAMSDSNGMIGITRSSLKYSCFHLSMNARALTRAPFSKSLRAFAAGVLYSNA